MGADPIRARAASYGADSRGKDLAARPRNCQSVLAGTFSACARRARGARCRTPALRVARHLRRALRDTCGALRPALVARAQNVKFTMLNENVSRRSPSPSAIGKPKFKLIGI